LFNKTSEWSTKKQPFWNLKALCIELKVSYNLTTSWNNFLIFFIFLYLFSNFLINFFFNFSSSNFVLFDFYIKYGPYLKKKTNCSQFYPLLFDLIYFLCNIWPLFFNYFFLGSFFEIDFLFFQLHTSIFDLFRIEIFYF
jgi:hypothetical protein